MKTLHFKQGLLVGIAVFGLVVLAPVATFAESEKTEEVHTQQRRQAEQEDHNSQATAEVADDEGQESAEKDQTQQQERRDQGKPRLEAAKLKSCQNREQSIKNIMTRISDRGTKQLGVFTQISDRVQTFYTTKGNTLSNYDDLVAKVNANKATAQAAVDAIKNNSSTFTCDNDNPKAVADSFKASLSNMRTALKEYKTSVKNLIVGVRSVQATTTENHAEGSQE